MSPSCWVTRRVKVRTEDGTAWITDRRRRPVSSQDVRWVVWFRVGGRTTPRQYAGTFRTRAEAEARERWIKGELAAGRVPDVRRHAQRRPTVAETMDDLLASLPSPKPALKKRFAQSKAQLGWLGKMDPEHVTRQDVQRWVNELTKRYAPATVAQYLIPVRQTLDHAELGRPNPARDPRLVLPSPPSEEEFQPPTREEFESMRASAGDRYRDVLTVLEGTGMRIAECLAFEWGDVDWQRGQIRVAAGRTKGGTGGRRWIPITRDVADVLAVRHAIASERDLAGAVFAGLTDQGARQAMRRGCERAGIAHYHPHDLRGRYISLLLIAGVPVELVRRIAGHRKLSMTLDRYSHVVLSEPPERLEELRRVVRVTFGLDDLNATSPMNSEEVGRMEDTGLEPRDP